MTCLLEGVPFLLGAHTEVRGRREDAVSGKNISIILGDVQSCSREQHVMKIRQADSCHQRLERPGYWHWKILQQKWRISLFVQLLGQSKAKESLKRNREEEKCRCPPVLSNTSYLGKYSLMVETQRKAFSNLPLQLFVFGDSPTVIIAIQNWQC